MNLKMPKMKKEKANLISDTSKLELHEEICAIRYKNIEDRMDSGSKRFVRMEQQIWGLYALIIASQVIGALV